MRISKRESDYLVKYLKEVVGVFENKEYEWIDPNDTYYDSITAEDVSVLNGGLLVKYELEKDGISSKYCEVDIPLVDFVIFCSQQK